MSYTIKIPSNLTLSSSIAFSRELRSIDSYEQYYIDPREISFAEPFGMLFLGSCLRSFIAERKNQSAKLQMKWENNVSNFYPYYMGFYKSFGADKGVSPGAGRVTDNHVPITEIPIKQLKEEAQTRTEVIQDTVEREAKKLATVLTQGEESLFNIMKYCLCEMMRNVVEHSGASSIWISAQYWPGRDLVEVAILDEGIGIMESLTKNKQLNVTNNENSLLLSVSPGVSCKPISKSKIIDDYWSNSGYGLYMTSNICKELKGDFVVCSGDKALTLDKSGEKFVLATFQGTAIRMTLKPSSIIPFSELKIRISKQGQTLARMRNNNTQPSKSSMGFEL